MSLLLPIGRAASAVVDISNNTSIFYQHFDGGIHVLSGTGPISGGARYTDRVVLTADKVRNDTPLATAVAVGTGLTQTKLYYVAPNNQLLELLWPQGVPGALNNNNFMVAPGSSTLYAVMSHLDFPRVGFQLAGAPAAITEASWDPNARIWSAAEVVV